MHRVADIPDSDRGVDWYVDQYGAEDVYDIILIEAIEKGAK